MHLNLLYVLGMLQHFFSKTFFRILTGKGGWHGTAVWPKSELFSPLTLLFKKSFQKISHSSCSSCYFLLTRPIFLGNLLGFQMQRTSHLQAGMFFSIRSSYSISRIYDFALINWWSACRSPGKATAASRRNHLHAGTSCPCLRSFQD